MSNFHKRQLRTDRNIGIASKIIYLIFIKKYDIIKKKTFFTDRPPLFYPSLGCNKNIFASQNIAKIANLGQEKRNQGFLRGKHILFARGANKSVFEVVYIASFSWKFQITFGFEKVPLQRSRSGGVRLWEKLTTGEGPFDLEKISLQRGPVGIRPCSVAGGRQKLSDTFGKMWEKRKVTFVMRKFAYGMGERKNGQAPLWSARAFQANV